MTVPTGSQDPLPDSLTVVLMTAHNHAIGRRVQIARKARGLTQQQLADRAHLSKSLVTKIERDERPATQPAVQTLARALNIAPADLTQPTPQSTERRDARMHAAIPGLERALLCYDLPPDEGELEPRPFPELQRDVCEAARLRMAAQYSRLADILPSLIDELILHLHMRLSSRTGILHTRGGLSVLGCGREQARIHASFVPGRGEGAVGGRQLR